MVNLAAATVVDSLDREEQLAIVDEARSILSGKMLKPSAGGRPMSVRIANAGLCGWVADERGYRYAKTNPVTGEPWPPIPGRWIEIASRVAGEHPWDCAHLVWYSPDACLGWHRDQTERDKSYPIVTISLGDEATWAVRSSEDGDIHRTRLRSGDVTLLAGPTRDLLHSVESIIAAPSLLAPSPLRSPGRLAVSLRVAL